jgi:hypothetical protein
MPDDLRARLTALEQEMRAEAETLRQRAGEQPADPETTLRAVVRETVRAGQLLADAEKIAAVLREPPAPVTAEFVAQMFHDTYERLALSFGYETREESRKPWSDVPEQNRLLMVAVAKEVIGAIIETSELNPLREPPAAVPHETIEEWDRRYGFPPALTGSAIPSDPWPEVMIAELKAAGWRPRNGRGTEWIAPNGGLYRGPAGAWRHMKAARAAAPEEQR